MRLFDSEVDRWWMLSRSKGASPRQAGDRGAWCTTWITVEIERALQRRCGLSEDYKEGVSAFKAAVPDFTAAERSHVQNRITELLGIQVPIVQEECSGWAAPSSPQPCRMPALSAC